MTVRDRRASPRIEPVAANIAPLAILWPGREVVVLDLSRHGVLIESATRLPPGMRTLLQLFGARRGMLRSHVDRCRVSRLDPLRYEAALVFDEGLDVVGTPLVMGSDYPAPRTRGGCAGIVYPAR